MLYEVITPSPERARALTKHQRKCRIRHYFNQPEGSIMFTDASILVTGGTGSFGKAFTRHVLSNYDPRRIIIFSRDEFKQDLMQKTFLKEFGPERCSKLRFFIGDVRDADRLRRAFKGVDYVVHAAALSYNFV